MRPVAAAATRGGVEAAAVDRAALLSLLLEVADVIMGVRAVQGASAAKGYTCTPWIHARALCLVRLLLVRRCCTSYSQYCVLHS